jgi:hypothetical protein
LKDKYGQEMIVLQRPAQMIAVVTVNVVQKVNANAINFGVVLIAPPQLAWVSATFMVAATRERRVKRLMVKKKWLKKHFVNVMVDSRVKTVEKNTAQTTVTTTVPVLTQHVRVMLLLRMPCLIVKCLQVQDVPKRLASLVTAAVMVIAKTTVLVYVIMVIQVLVVKSTHAQKHVITAATVIAMENVNVQSVGLVNHVQLASAQLTTTSHAQDMVNVKKNKLVPTWYTELAHVTLDGRVRDVAMQPAQQIHPWKTTCLAAQRAVTVKVNAWAVSATVTRGLLEDRVKDLHVQMNVATMADATAANANVMMTTLDHHAVREDAQMDALITEFAQLTLNVTVQTDFLVLIVHHQLALLTVLQEVCAWMVHASVTKVLLVWAVRLAYAQTSALTTASVWKLVQIMLSANAILVTRTKIVPFNTAQKMVVVMLVMAMVHVLIIQSVSVNLVTVVLDAKRWNVNQTIVMVEAIVTRLLVCAPAKMDGLVTAVKERRVKTNALTTASVLRMVQAAMSVNVIQDIVASHVKKEVAQQWLRMKHVPVMVNVTVNLSSVNVMLDLMVLIATPKHAQLPPMVLHAPVTVSAMSTANACAWIVGHHQTVVCQHVQTCVVAEVLAMQPHNVIVTQDSRVKIARRDNALMHALVMVNVTKRLTNVPAKKVLKHGWVMTAPLNAIARVQLTENALHQFTQTEKITPKPTKVHAFVITDGQEKAATLKLAKLIVVILVHATMVCANVCLDIVVNHAPKHACVSMITVVATRVVIFVIAMMDLRDHTATKDSAQLEAMVKNATDKVSVIPLETVSANLSLLAKTVVSLHAQQTMFWLHAPTMEFATVRQVNAFAMILTNILVMDVSILNVQMIALLMVHVIHPLVPVIVRHARTAK